MINLLSTETKQQLRAARINVVLRRYVFFLAFIAAFVVGSFFVGQWVLAQEEATHKNYIHQYDAEKAKYARDLADSRAFAQNLATTKTILSNEILFSEVITSIAGTLPPGAVLKSLNLTTESLTKPMVFEISTTSYDNAVRIKDAFERSPVFENVSLNSVTEQKESKSKYRFDVSLNATITKSAMSGGGN